MALGNSFSVPVEFRFLDANEYELYSPVIVGTEKYVAAKVSRVSQSEIAYGYSFEAFCLFAHFDLTLKGSGIGGCFAVDDPGFAADDSIEYIVTYEVKH